MLSLRQEILTILRERSLTLKELGQTLGLREKDVADHLAHAARSLAEGEELCEHPAECLACGFPFQGRRRLSTPGRCPRCRSERIRPASFRVHTRTGG
ncbi:MAG: transcriptional regulator [Deltaproteobacteria bacterium]|nr:transcriptional regulator [Deltaproteobacteria bacterium]